MNVPNRNWRPQWPVVPPRLWLTVAATVIAGLSLFFQQEIWSHKPTAELWTLIVLGLLMQFGGAQVIGMLRVWLREYRGPGWMRLLMWATVLPIYVAVSLLALGFALFLSVGLGSITMN